MLSPFAQEHLANMQHRMQLADWAKSASAHKAANAEARELHRLRCALTMLRRGIADTKAKRVLASYGVEA